MLLGAGYRSDYFLLSRTRCSLSGASTLSLECITPEFCPGDRPLPESEPGVVVVDDVIPVRLSVRHRSTWTFTPVSRTDRGRSMTGGHSLTSHVFGRPCLRFGPVKTSPGERVRCYGFFVYTQYSTGSCVFRPVFRLNAALQVYHRFTTFSLHCLSTRAAFRRES